MVAFASGEPEPGYGSYCFGGDRLPGTVRGYAKKFRAAGKARGDLLHPRQAQRRVRSERQSAAIAHDPVAARPRDACPGAVAGHLCEGRAGVRLVPAVPEGISRLPGPAGDLSENVAARPLSEEDVRGGKNSERG